MDMANFVNLISSPHIQQAFMISLIFWTGVFVIIQTHIESRSIHYWMSPIKIENQIVELVNEPSNIINTSITSSRTKPVCLTPVINSSKLAKLVIQKTVIPPKLLDESFPHIRMGGHWEPEQCVAHQKLGIFIPLKGRENYLYILLRHLHHLLVSQQCHYTFYVIEQGDENPFNRGKLFNVGVIEALKLEPDLDCFILHDVDTLPETNHTIYRCHDDSRLALEMATYQKKKKYKKVSDDYTGGVLAVHRMQYEVINGYSNKIWNSENDDLASRLRKNGYDIVQELSHGGYFYSLDHAQTETNSNRSLVPKKDEKNLFKEGLNNTEYTLLKIEKKRLFTLFKVDTDTKVKTESLRNR